MRRARSAREGAAAMFAALSLLSLPSCIFSRGGEVVRTDPTVEPGEVFADTVGVLLPAAKEEPATAPPEAPPPRETVVRPEPSKPPPQAAPPEVSVGLSDGERERLRREAEDEIAAADSLIRSARARPLAPEEEEVLLTAEELLRGSRAAYVRADFSGAVGLARKARVLAAGLSGSRKE